MATRLLFAAPRSPYNRIGDCSVPQRRVRAGRAALRLRVRLLSVPPVRCTLRSSPEPALAPRCARSPWAVRAGAGK